MRSISVKLIVTTSSLVVFVVVGTALLNFRNAARVYDANAIQTERRIREQMRKVGSATVETTASATRTYFEQSNDIDMRAYVAQLAANNDEVSFMYILDQDKGLVAHSDAKKNPRAGHPPVSEPSWKIVAAAWRRQSTTAKSPALIAALEFQAKEERVSLFAHPVFPANVAGSAKLAIDPNTKSRPLGYIVIGYTLRFLDESLSELQTDREAANRDLTLRTALLGGFFVLLGVVLAVALGLRLSRPIQLLTHRARQLAGGDLGARVEINTKDEIGFLGQSFNYMADHIALLIDEASQRATLEKELLLAREIQFRLVPADDVIATKRVSLAALFRPAEKCGGDWWTYHELEDGRILLAIGDVTGHGVPSAMITTSAKAACDAARMKLGVTCNEIMKTMNIAVYEAAKGDYIMTAFLAIVDPKKKSITWSNAGHNFPYVRDEHGEVSCLLPGGNPLGLDAEHEFTMQSRSLQGNETFVLFTDGIVEGQNNVGAMYGDRRFMRAVTRHTQKSPEQARDALVNAAFEFFGDTPPADDITLVVVRFPH